MTTARSRINKPSLLSKRPAFCICTCSRLPQVIPDPDSSHRHRTRPRLARGFFSLRPVSASQVASTRPPFLLRPPFFRDQLQLAPSPRYILSSPAIAPATRSASSSKGFPSFSPFTASCRSCKNNTAQACLPLPSSARSPSSAAGRSVSARSPQILPPPQARPMPCLSICPCCPKANPGRPSLSFHPLHRQVLAGGPVCRRPLCRVVLPDDREHV